MSTCTCRLFLAVTFFCSQWAIAQLPNDALMLSRGQWCVMTQYVHDHWTHYWEGSTKRSNLNLGTVTVQSIAVGLNYALANRLNLIAMLPYVWTYSSASYLDGQRGVQDLSLWIKYQLFEVKASLGEFRLQATGGLSTPVSNYVADYMPLNIGLQSRTASLRIIANFTQGKGLYFTAQAGHTWRSNITVDRDAFLFHNQLYYTRRMPVPNLFDASARIGFINARWQVEAQLSYFTCTSGDDIRYNEMPQPTNKMRATAASVFVKHFLWRGLALQAAYGHVLSGRNLGQSNTLSGGISYLFQMRHE
ncbi:MAG: transporter [Saprospiraceae bacterium]|nr:transporter [Saprospiraceae bacterium]MDW8483929.1 transporter [Saprospiraceae bacterium]